ncbi:hypothetical protein JCM13664_14490 [Methylothermus subterraneus]
MPETFSACQDCPCFCFELGTAFAISLTGQILKVSPTLAEELGYRQAELEDKSLKALLGPEGLTAARAFLSFSDRTQFAVRLRARGGELIPALLFACRFKDHVKVWVKLGERATERQKRELLIREVHHRIKNNLQGIAGLLYNQALAHPQLKELLETPIRQINAIAQLYSLRSQGQDRVFLCQLCQIIAQAGLSLSQVALTLDIPYLQAIEVQDQEAVSIALVLNELLANAIKHGQGPITLSLRKQAEEAQVRIQNPSPKPPAFDLAQGVGLGTGLQLVKALLPQDGSATLTFAWEAGEMTAALSLRPPLVRFVRQSGL